MWFKIHVENVHTAVRQTYIDGLPDPKGSLSEKLQPWKIDKANYQVQAVQVAEGGKKQGSYNKYSNEERAATRRYACQHAAFTAAWYFRES